MELALSYLQQNNPQLAKINLDKALQHDKNYYLVHSALAHYYQQQGQIENAFREYEIAVKLNHKQGDVHNNFGTFLCSQKKFEQAQQQFELALNSPNYYHQADTFENIALCAYSAKKNGYLSANIRKITSNRWKTCGKIQ